MSTLTQEVEAGTLLLDTSDPALPRFAVDVNGTPFGIRRVRSISPGVLLIEQERVLGSLPPDSEPTIEQFNGQAVFVDIETVDENDNPLGWMTLSGIASVTTMEDLERLVLVIQMQVGAEEDC
jgi:hypothetical protein